MSIDDMHTFSHLKSRGPELPARNSLFIRGLLCTLLVACPALAEPITGLDDIKLGADRTLRLAVRPEARCVLGDLDAISLEMKRMAQERADPAATNMLLTIEPLASSSFPPVVKSMSQGEVNPKQGASFVLPQSPGWTLAGVFICMAQGKQGEARACRDKKIVTYDKVLQSYRVDVDYKTGEAHKRPSSGPVEDKVYFFRYIILHDDLVYFSSQPMSEARYEALASLLASKAPGDGKGTEELVGAVKALNELQSVPLKKDGDQLIVTLPFYDKAKCGHHR